MKCILETKRKKKIKLLLLNICENITNQNFIKGSEDV